MYYVEKCVNRCYNLPMNENIGYKIRRLRHKKKETIEQVSTAVGISASALGMYERGMRNPDMKTLLKLAAYFDVDLGYLYHSSEEEIRKIKDAIESNIYNEDEVTVAKSRAKGNCELCGHRAPFFHNNGEPYLEPYSIDNQQTKQRIGLTLLCPNCKRKMEVLNLQGDLNYLKNRLNMEAE